MKRIQLKAYRDANTLKGLGIALVAAQKAGVSVTLVDTNQASIDKGLKFAGRSPFQHHTYPA